MNELTIAPNRPLTVALVDPEGRFDFETGMGQYQTTTGELVTLPRPAVVILNTLDPQPGEEIVITKHWSGKPAEKAEWTILLSSRTENTRAKAEEKPTTLSEQLEASIEHERERRRSLGDPTPIRRPAKRAPAPEIQPRLCPFCLGTSLNASCFNPSGERIRGGFCPHERLNEDGICRQCGADRRGI